MIPAFSSANAALRQTMIDCQLRPNRVTDPAVLAAFAAVAREDFVPQDRRACAYLDDDIPLPGGRVVLSPMILGRMLQAAEAVPGERALLIGVGEGYLAALLAHMGVQVMATEVDAELGALAQKNIEAYVPDLPGQVSFAMVHNLADGWAGSAPYDLIFINGAYQELPGILSAQLSEGGRLLAVRMPQKMPLPVMGHIVCGVKRHGHISFVSIIDAAAPVLMGMEEKSGFSL